MAGIVDECADPDIAAEIGALTGPPQEATISPRLRGVLEEMRQTGVPRYPWELLKKLISAAIVQCITDFRSSHPESPETQSGQQEQTERLLQALDAFDGAPFTLQRICELIAEPGLHYGALRKLLFSFERLVSVSSTIDVIAHPEAVANGGEAATAAPAAIPGE